jgi:hypothetical protein
VPAHCCCRLQRVLHTLTPFSTNLAPYLAPCVNSGPPVPQPWANSNPLDAPALTFVSE